MDYEALLKEHEDVKKRLEASKARNKYLSTENKTLKSQISDLLVKSKHDDELVDALLVRVQLRLHLELLNENRLFPTTLLFSLKSEHVSRAEPDPLASSSHFALDKVELVQVFPIINQPPCSNQLKVSHCASFGNTWKSSAKLVGTEL